MCLIFKGRLTRFRLSVAPLLRFDQLRNVTNTSCDMLRDGSRNMVFRTCYVHCCALLRTVFRYVTLLLRHSYVCVA